MNDFAAVLDACVLVQACLRDTLLRLAEEPALFRPVWSQAIIEETARALQSKLKLTSDQVARLTGQLETHFPEAWVYGHESLVDAIEVDPRDRHVVAAAVRAGAQTIVTFNIKHFPSSSLEPLGIDVQTPDEFLVHQYHLSPALVCRKIVEQAAAIGRHPEAVVETLAKSANRFADLVRLDLSTI